ncbi:MAG: RNA polymerase sigma factor [Planctomycetota bacterium]|nr:RNA polymerase sigma factor [Planctomycetota bacterium]MDA1140602.1 RNA polymerase sigma factor [Planctomycetota bacterium]
MKQAERRSLYSELVSKHATDLYRFAYRLCGRNDAAEDLVQEAFTEAWRSFDSLREISKARAWLFQILRHRYSHWMRDNSRRLQLESGGIEEVEYDSSVSSPDHSEQLSRQETLNRALGALEDRYKEPFLMVFLEGLSCKEAAASLDIPLGTVLSRIHRARHFLRKFLKKSEEADDDINQSRSPDTGITPFRLGGQA